MSARCASPTVLPQAAPDKPKIGIIGVWVRFAGNAVPRGDAEAAVRPLPGPLPYQDGSFSLIGAHQRTIAANLPITPARMSAKEAHRRLRPQPKA